MRTNLILTFGLLALLGATAHAQSYSSKSAFSKNVKITGTADSTPSSDGRLARVTAYWPGEDFYTTRKQSATGLRLRIGYCAVDSRIIPYGSTVKIPGLGSFLAVDTGSAVISRKAARLSGHNAEERGALVIDIFFPTRRAGEAFAAQGPKFALVQWNAGELASD